MPKPARQLRDAIACRREAADRVAPIEQDGELDKSRDARLVVDRARIQRSLSARDRAIEMGGLLSDVKPFIPGRRQLTARRCA